MNPKEKEMKDKIMKYITFQEKQSKMSQKTFNTKSK